MGVGEQLARQVGALLMPPPRGKRHKPEEILYGLDERPPLGTLILIGLQHAALSLMLGIYAVIAGQSIGLGSAQTAHYVASCFFVLGLGTMLQAMRTRFTPGVPLVSMPNSLSLAAYVAVVVQFGLGAAMGAIIVSNLAVILLARFLPRLRAVFPPEVIGVVVLMLGLSMVAGGVERSTGLGNGDVVSSGAVIVAGITVAIVVALSVWGSAQMRTMAVLMGTICGVAAAFLAGTTDLDAFSGIAELPVLGVPIISTPLPWPVLIPAAIAPIFLTELLSAMDQFACALTLDKLNDARWRRADMPMVSRSIMASGIANVLHGLSGQLTSGSSSANIGLSHSSGIMSRHVGFVAGGALCVVGFLPILSGLIAFTPAPVIGGILIYTASFLIVAGMDLILSRLLNTQRTFVVGLSVVLGTSVMVLPQLVDQAPAWSLTIVESGLTVGSLTAIALNALFRIGIKQSAAIDLPDGDGARAATDFLEHHGKAWGARKDVVMRAGIALGESLEALIEAGVVKGPVTLQASFDEFNLACRLVYLGVALPIRSGGSIDASALLEEDDDAALDLAMLQLSSVLVTRLADRVQSSEKSGRAELRLNFDH